MILKAIANISFALGGWTVSEWTYPTHCVCIEAPHTSMWDFFWGKLYFAKWGLKCGVMIKKESFYFPMGIFLKALGAIPVNRKSPRHLIDSQVEALNSHKQLVVIFTPEGTRKKTTKWKPGFYHVALKANVPIVLGYLDYKKKHAGVFGVFQPTGNFEEDIKTIKSYYININAKYPENFSADL